MAKKTVKRVSRRSSQKPHYRRSKKGRKFVAGRGKPKRDGSGRGTRANKGRGGCMPRMNRNATPADLSQRERKQVFQEEIAAITADLKKTGKARIPGIGNMRIIRKKATKRRMMNNPFKPGEKWVVKAKPARKMIKISAVKALKDKVK